ncbi:MAG TPA: hypothetical protein DCR97_10490, partial [Deltaproteobacteria bacterium]|nr:hypothetical protein [Deltaproteobacteria bacterium]
RARKRWGEPGDERRQENRRALQKSPVCVERQCQIDARGGRQVTGRGKRVLDLLCLGSRGDDGEGVRGGGKIFG